MLDQSACLQGLILPTLRVEEELSRLQAWEASSSASTSDSICRALCGLEELYECLDDLLHMASTQQLLSQHEQEKYMDELLMDQ
ncbi:hypothetical protein GBA52_025332 [Prunus armeniaca]|nr:hypothetical protein GBA52_025332 [Prunus armeniaca]